MEKIIKSKVIISTILGFVSGIIICLLTSYLVMKDLLNAKIPANDIVVVISLSLFVSILVFCPIISGLGAISGFILTKSINHFWKFVLLFFLSIICGLIGFFSFDLKYFGDKINIDVLVLSISFFLIFMLVFLVFQIPFYIFSFIHREHDKS